MADAKAEDRTQELAAFFLEHRSLLRRYLVAQGCPECDSDDIVQDAFLIIRARWDTIAYYDNPKAYLYKVAIRLWHRDTVRRRRKSSHGDQHSLLEAIPDRTDILKEVELADTLNRWFRQLPVQQRNVAGLRLIADLPEVVTAEALGISLGTVKSQLNAARKRLSQLRDQDQDDGRDRPRDEGERR
ncbi:RNA polymerase sigma factor [Spirillospora sp. CA-128828]|uniref:RNA polymerase sigma factor n=1 Tax=Spirillospora sp. CA-128828 TaxID=3240033 RepID=UPI003D8EF1AD